MSRLDVASILYLCDGRACGETCPNELCHHTNRPEHALHKDANVEGFVAVPSRVDGKVDLWEPRDEG